MANLTSVGVTSGVPTSGTGTVSTIDALMADGGQATLGAKADAASTATDTTAVSAISIWKQISKTLQAFAGAASTALFSKITDGTNTATVTASSALKVDTFGGTTPVFNAGTRSVSTLRVTQATDDFDFGAGTGGTKTQRVIVDSSQAEGSEYETVAASATNQVIGPTGAVGDYLSHVVVSPAAANCGVVTILDNATAVVSFAGGGTTALSNLIPFVIPVGITSTSGAWKITTGTNVSVVAVGNFT